MDIRKKIRITLISASVLVLLGSIASSGYLLFFNFQNVQLFRQAENNFKQGSSESLKLAEAQLLELVRNDPDNERAFILLGGIAKQKKVYPEQVYYTLQAHKLNPLSEENEKAYVESLLYAREFGRLETFLSQKGDLKGEWSDFLLYAAGQNGNINKYRKMLDRRSNNLIAELVLLLYKHTQLDDKRRLAALHSYLTLRAKTDFEKQEILAALVRIYLSRNDLDDAEKHLLEAYRLNEFAFAPVLGRFYANYRSMGKALEVFEKYLMIYHDPAVALQCGEIYCLLKKREKIAALNKKYQADSGKGAMLLNYYFEVLEKFAANDVAACRPYLVPLQKAVNTPLATFIYFCAALEEGELTAVHKYYNALLGHRPYLDLQMRSDRLIIEGIKRAIASGKSQEAVLLELADKVYWRTPDVTVGKFLLLSQRQKGSLSILLLTDLMKRFPKDPGVNKIAVEHYLGTDLAMAGKLIAGFMRDCPGRQADMLRYRILLAARQKDFDQVSRLFQQNFSPETAGGYWNFAIRGKRLADLRFLAARAPGYKPFCEAAIHLAAGKKEQALDLLARADAGKNEALLFYAAKTLGENDRVREALALYRKFPESSPYRLDVLLNTAELHSVLGNKAEAALLAEKAYRSAPSLPVVQFCYADKLYKSGKYAPIADIIKLGQVSPYDDKMRKYLAASLEYLLKNSDLQREKEKILNMSDRLLRISPNNRIALEYRNKVLLLRKKE